MKEKLEKEEFFANLPVFSKTSSEKIASLAQVAHPY
jgi:hypothetical protein